MAARFPAIVSLLLTAVFLIVFLPHEGSPRQKEPMKIGVSSMITPVDTVKYYQEIIDYIGEQIRKPVRMVHRRTYGEMDALIERGDVKIAFVCSASYVMNRKDFGVELLAAPSVNGKAVYHSYIIAHKDSALRSFTGLKGKTFAFTDPKSNSGYLYPVYLLKTMGTAPEKFFKKYNYSYSHNKSVELVAKKLADAAAVDSLVYDYMLKKGSPYAQQVRVIKRSPPYGIPPVVVSRDIDPALKEKIRNVLLTMHKTPKGKAILDAMMIDGFVRMADSAYDSIRKMERALAADANDTLRMSSSRTIRFGVIPRDNPRILYEKYQPLLDYLAKRTPHIYELVLKRTYEETVQGLGNGEIDVALLGPLTYLEARARYGVSCILRPKGIDGSATYRSVIVTKKDADIAAISELKGKRVAFAAVKSTSGNLIPRYLLANSGIHLKDLERYTNFDYHDSVVKAVLKGQYHAGSVRDSVAQKYAKLGIKAIAESETVPTGPLVAGPAAPLQAIGAIKTALLELDPRNSRHKAITDRLDDDLRYGFVEASDNDYLGIRERINAIPQSCGRSCHPNVRL